MKNEAGRNETDGSSLQEGDGLRANTGEAIAASKEGNRLARN
jgi:hypothetical protein